MAYTPPSGEQLNFNFDNVLSGDPNFDFRVFDVIQAIIKGAVLKGATIR